MTTSGYNENIKADTVVYKIEKGSLGEDSAFSIITNHEITTYDNREQPCKHCHSPHEVFHMRSDMSEWSWIYWICPLVVIASNQGGYDSTCICVSCFLEGINKNKINIPNEQLIIPQIPKVHQIGYEALKTDGWEYSKEKDCHIKNGNLIRYSASDENRGYTLNDNTSVGLMEELPDYIKRESIND